MKVGGVEADEPLYGVEVGLQVDLLKMLDKEGNIDSRIVFEYLGIDDYANHAGIVIQGHDVFYKGAEQPEGLP